MEDDLSALFHLFNYNPETGLLTWKPRKPDMFTSNHSKHANTWNSRYAGKAVGSPAGGGYLSTVVYGKRMMVHRIAWLLHNQKPIPEGHQIDHIDGNRLNNKASNLRLCTPSQNQYNVDRSSSNKLRGAFFHKRNRKWQSSIRVHLGSYDTEEEAAKAYESFAKYIHDNFYLPNGKRPTLTKTS